MTEARFDVCVVGGGINGAGVAQAASARGWSVLVLERSALAAGTSSRSSKLVHGGLRYLESAQFGLVRECLRERRTLLRIAPDLVRLVPFNIPVFTTTRRSAWQIRLGLSLYAVLGGLGEANRFRQVAESDWPDLDGLSVHNLLKVYRYFDASTDDAELTRAVMKSALDLGARLVLPARFDGADRHAQGFHVSYTVDGAHHVCECATLVNAAGPWIGQIASRVRPALSLPAVELVQGAHIVVPGTFVHGNYYLESPLDGRAVFVMPQEDRLLVGTTETPFHGDPADVRPLPAEQDYLLGVLAHYFPRYQNFSRDSIQSSFAGLRVLPAGGGTAFAKPRETILATDDPKASRAVTIIGGKLTAYRATAEKVADRLAPALPVPDTRIDTRTIKLKPGRRAS